MDIYFSPNKLPLYVIAKPVGATCNLNCIYCYYLEKEKIYNSHSKTYMNDNLLEKYIRNYIEAQARPEIQFTWHGGEPLMRGIDFYKKALTYQIYYSRGKHIKVDNSLQTNGTLLTDEWCAFFAKHNFLIGISLDGTAHCHDYYRKNHAGISTHNQVIKGIRLLQKHGVEFNILSIVNKYNANYPIEIYRYFKELGCRYMQFTPVVERTASNTTNNLQLASPENEEGYHLSEWSVDALAYGRFLTAIFDEWVRTDVGSYYVINFDSTLANWVGVEPATCVHAPTCGHALALEFNGDVYACDHFVFPQYKRGNINDKSLLQIANSPEQIQFGKNKREQLPTQCFECEYLSVCNGECPKNRFLYTNNNEQGLNYLCTGLKHYYRHVTPYMNFMAEEIRNNRPPANVMRFHNSL